MAENTGLFEKIGRYPKIVRDKNVAQTAALTVNDLVDEHFSKAKRPIPVGAKTRYAKRQDTDVVTVLARESVRQEYDPITGLLSYAKFEQTFSQLLEHNIALDEQGEIKVNRKELLNTQIIKVDIGHLGYPNDELPGGYPLGTAYKKNVAHIVKEETLRLTQEFEIEANAYAWSAGDELGVLARCGRKEASLLAKRIQDRVSQITIEEGAELPATASCGVVSAGEFLDGFIDFSRKIGFTPKEILEKYKVVLESVVDYREKYIKYLQRMDLFRDLYIRFHIDQSIDDSRYEKLYGYAAKNSIGIDETELFELMTEPIAIDSEAGQLISLSEFQKKAVIWVKDVLKKRAKGAITARADRPLELFILKTEESIIDSL